MILRLLRTSSISLKSFTNARCIFTSNTLLKKSDSDDDKPKNEKETEPINDENSKDPAKKLNELIKLMSKKEEPSLLASKVKIPKPREKAREAYKESLEKKKKLVEKQEDELLDNQITDAAAKVAESLGGDTRKTEMELLSIYLSRRSPTDSKDATKSDKPKPLSDVLSGMKVEKEQDTETSRARQVRSMMKDDKPKQFLRKPAKSRQYVRIDLFGETPFGYFDAKTIEEKNVTPLSLSTWELLNKRELKLAVTQPPRNIFEQLIMWTEQGKIWRFPIDNEQDWHEEEKYDFSEHVFLERWLEPWCPESGPIRHFMELVCTGLSKNPYLTVPEKQAHIFWYEHYFRTKKDLLLEIGAGEIKDRPRAEESSA